MLMNMYEHLPVFDLMDHREKILSVLYLCAETIYCLFFDGFEIGVIYGDTSSNGANQIYNAMLIEFATSG